MGRAVVRNGGEVMSATPSEDDLMGELERSTADGLRRGCGQIVGDLTKRELFAAMAMQGIAMQYVQGGDFMEQHIAKGAVLMADALLKELAK